MNLRWLGTVAATRSKEQFVAEWPSPVLLLLVPSGEQSLDRRETLMSELPVAPYFRTHQGCTSPIAYLRTADAVVLSIQKSSRNPFADMICLGRADNNDLVIRDPTVSKSHAFFARRLDGGWRVQDNGSTNGVSVNGVQIATRASCDIEDGVELAFGPRVIAVFKKAEELHDLLRLVLPQGSATTG